jgi:two-component system, NarL family, response regulator YdfI
LKSAFNGALNGSDERIRVLVIGESPVVRAGLEAAISDSDRFEVVGNCNLAGSASLFESTAAAAVLMESATFSNWLPGSVPETESSPKLASASLTPREIEVLRLLADGASNKIIGHKLGISDHTVKFHVTSILSKMNAGTRTEAVTLGVRMGLVYL